MRLTLGIVVALAACLNQPAQAWEHGFDAAAGGLTHWATGTDLTGQAKLSFYCSTSMPGAVYAQLNTGTPGNASNPGVEFTIDVDGVIFGPLDARIDASEGSLIVYTASQQDAAGQAARAAYASNGRVHVMYLASAWAFDGADYADAFGAMLDSCG